MSSRAHRWEAGNTPLSAYHGGSAAAARSAVKASIVTRLKEQLRKSEEALAAKAAEAPAALKHRLRPRARRQLEAGEARSRWNCRESRWREHSGVSKELRRPFAPQDASLRRQILIVAQNGLCALCGLPLDEAERKHPSRRPSIEHVIPRDLGGVDYRNIVAAHNQCNADKSNDIPTGCEVVWLLVVNGRMSRLSDEMQTVFYR